MDNEPWQRRAKRAGLSQKDLARLLGVAENTVSRQLRGKWADGAIPRYVVNFIRAWERLSAADRAALLDDPEGEG
jgi:transcriptional regulator with XRE-family HTH domain